MWVCTNTFNAAIQSLRSGYWPPGHPSKQNLRQYKLWEAIKSSQPLQGPIYRLCFTWPIHGSGFFNHVLHEVQVTAEPSRCKPLPGTLPCHRFSSRCIRTIHRARDLRMQGSLIAPKKVSYNADHLYIYPCPYSIFSCHTEPSHGAGTTTLIPGRVPTNLLLAWYISSSITSELQISKSSGEDFLQIHSNLGKDLSPNFFDDEIIQTSPDRSSYWCLWGQSLQVWTWFVNGAQLSIKKSHPLRMRRVVSRSVQTSKPWSSAIAWATSPHFHFSHSPPKDSNALSSAARTCCTCGPPCQCHAHTSQQGWEWYHHLLLICAFNPVLFPFDSPAMTRVSIRISYPDSKSFPTPVTFWVCPIRIHFSHEWITCHSSQNERKHFIGDGSNRVFVWGKWKYYYYYYYYYYSKWVQFPTRFSFDQSVGRIWYAS